MERRQTEAICSGVTSRYGGPWGFAARPCACDDYDDEDNVWHGCEAWSDCRWVSKLLTLKPSLKFITKLLLWAEVLWAKLRLTRL